MLLPWNTSHWVFGGLHFRQTLAGCLNQCLPRQHPLNLTPAGQESVCVVMSLRCRPTPPQNQWWQHQVSVLILWPQKRKASMMFNQLLWGQECSPLAREQNSWHKWSLLPPFEVGPNEISEHGSSLNHRIFAHIPDWPNLEGHSEFTFSESRALPKETESMQLKLLGGHKRRVISPSLSPSVCSSVWKWHNGHVKTVVFILIKQKLKIN